MLNFCPAQVKSLNRLGSTYRSCQMREAVPNDYKRPCKHLYYFSFAGQVLKYLLVRSSRTATPMAFPFIYLVCFLLFSVPGLSLSCSKVERCGDVDISYPFFTNTTPPDCGAIFYIECDYSEPMIQLKGIDYKVTNISYPDHVITIQDPTLSDFLFDTHCSFLFNFAVPIPSFDFVNRRPTLRGHPFSCTPEIYESFVNFFHSTYNSTSCRDYSLYYWNESEYLLNHYNPASCSGSRSTLFEWALSFSEENGYVSFSLLSAGFPGLSVLSRECFNCQFTRKNCSSSDDVKCKCEPSCLHSAKKGSKASTTIIGVGSALGASFLLICLTVAVYLCKNREVSSNKNIEVFLEEYGGLAPKRYSYSNVKKITKAFQEKLGQGGYGTVFKGTLSNGHLVAVKILKDTQGDGEEFINEIASICGTSHVNVVSLLGFCFEGSKRALIYDYMCNGSLEKLLCSEKSRTALEWENLYRIAIGIARGLEYLHRGCNTRIVHFDIKPHNILLDQDFCPKISDFGLAKLCQKKDSIISIAGARGTIGYIAPEVFSRNFGIVSSKSDVYSYGMMLLEIAGGRKNANTGDKSSEEYFPHWIYEHLNKNGNLLAYGITAESEETVRKMTLVGLWCIQTMPQNRPPMSRVIEMLEGSVDDLQVPPQPYLSSSPFGSLIGTSIQDIRSDDCSCLIH